MSTPIKDQSQHRVSQTYLKQWGLRDNGGRWIISVYELDNPVTKYEFVKPFTSENNLFDLDFFEGETERKFEENCSAIETHYTRLIKSIQRDNFLNDKYTEVLTHFLPSLLCRNIPFREWVELLIMNNDTREKFFNEITMFKKDGLEKTLLMNLDQKLPVKFQVNFVMFYVMQFFLEVLPSFNFVILKDYKDRGWFTTDNPVVFDKNDNHIWTIPLESEFYLPLNPTYCLYVYHPNGTSENKLRKLGHQTINQTNEETHQLINDKISRNLINFLIAPADMGETDLRNYAT
ncbi:MAG: DUF4238 domain-containing protein [Cyclobacteriaceae bacterium]